jgi:hypothetical protein
MSDEKVTPPPETPPVSTASDSAAEKPAAAPAFKSDEFLAGSKAKPKLDTSTAFVAAAKTETAPKTTPQVIKRGGISFFTALLMSTVATAGGAYLALFLQARPDMAKLAGIGAFLPKATPDTGAAGTSASFQPLAQRVSAIEAELLVLQNRLAALDPKAGDSATAPDTLPKLGTPPLPIPGAAPATNPPSVANPASPPSLPQGNNALADVGLLKSELAGIGGRVTAIETRLAALDPTGAGGAVVAGLQADIASLKSMVTALQQQVAAAPSPAVTMAVVNLAEAAARSGPFLTEYETLRSAMGNGPEIAALEAFARTGVPTRTILQERFATLAPAIASAAATAQKDGGFVVWLRSLFSDMVKVTPAPDPNGKSGGDILLRAKTKLDQGDLSASADDLATLQNPPAPVVEWIAAARKRVDLESRLSAVRGLATRPPVQPVAAPNPAIAGPPSIGPAPTAAPVIIPTPKGTNP